MTVETCLKRIDLRVGDSLRIGGTVRIELERKSGQVARLCVVAPREVTVHREGALSNPHQASDDAVARLT